MRDSRGVCRLPFRFRFPTVPRRVRFTTRSMVAPLLRLLFCTLAGLISVAGADFQLGTATRDITPSYPIRLSGYAARKTESEGVRLPLKGKALALSQANGQTALILSLDNCGIPREIWQEITTRIERAHSIPAERIVIFSSHTHSGPALTGAINNLFAGALPPREQATVDRYTRELIDHMVLVAAQALQELRPVRLYFAQGRAMFAKNRRHEGGPVDHDVPVLVARSADGTARAVLANYACHCTTLQGDHNFMHPDWAGVAQAALEAASPDLTALVAIGCGADSNPHPRGQVEHSSAHGEELAREVRSMLELPMDQITSALEFRALDFSLAFVPLPTRAEWEKRAAEPGIVGYHAKQNLARLDRGERLPEELPYRVQTWNFGDQLAMVFLPGEVVVDYALRLKKELDARRLWVSAYANWVPCYIPSVRILEEGGYEAESSLWYYDQPARLSPDTEVRIINAVHQLLPSGYASKAQGENFPNPRSPRHSLAAIRTEPQLKVQLVAAEPLIASPVAIDWAADGRLWVVEMRDFPSGMDDRLKAGGRVKILEDVNGDGAMDRATTFLENIPFPTGITCWNGGALICAAPDILFARDTDADGKADTVKKMFSGFATENYQARVNSLSLGLDGWFYGANGLVGGKISGGTLTAPLNISNRDFRFRPETGAFETASGITQQGRVRDDFGNWFGCDNSTLIWHYPLHDHYLSRNPHVAPPSTRVPIAAGSDPNKLFPISQPQERFNYPEHINRTTAACGLGIYRDDLLGTEFYGDAFICEPVHNLVRRMEMREEGATLQAFKPAGERREFLASQDSWFRPVQARTGPDGALWVVDMYRMVVEHPRWITPERLKTLNLRAGEDLGRIYRILPKSTAPRPIENLNRTATPALAGKLNTPNGTERDRVQLEIARRGEKSSELSQSLESLATGAELAAVRIQALSTLNALEHISTRLILDALEARDENVRAFAVFLAERQAGNRAMERSLLKMAADPSATVRFQLACTLGNIPGKRATEALLQLFRSSRDSWTRFALLSSARGRSLEIAEKLETPTAELIRPLMETALAENADSQGRLLQVIARAGGDLEVWQLEALRAVARVQPRNSRDLTALLTRAQEIAEDSMLDSARRSAAIRVLAFSPTSKAGNILRSILISGENLELVSAAAESLVARGEAGKIYPLWPKLSPTIRRAVTAAVLRRSEFASSHLAHLEETGSLAELSPPERQQLLKSTNPATKAQAQRLFGNVERSSRSDALKKYEKLNIHAASNARGAALFGTHCASCHHFRGQGFSVGPNLGALSDRSGTFLLTAMIDPNAAVENRYLGYSIETVDGSTLSGVIADENASSLTLANASGLRQQVLRKDILAILPSKLSLMPEGLEAALSEADMADLITFLQFTPAEFGAATGDRAAKARDSFARTATPIRILSASETSSYASWMGRLPLRLCRQADGQARVEWEATVRTNAAGEATFEFPAALGFVSQPKGSFELYIDGVARLRFDAATTDDTWESADGSVRAHYLVMDRNAEDSSGILRIQVKSGGISGPSAIFLVKGSAANSQRWFGIYELPEGRADRK